jgi:hypothetical protein
MSELDNNQTAIEPSQDNTTTEQPTAQNAEAMIKEALQQAKEAPKEEVTVEEPKKPAGYERVEINDPKVQERLNYLYKQVKSSDETNQILRQEHSKIAKALEITLQKIDLIEQKKAKDDEDGAVKQLKSQIRHARDLGNDDEAERLDEMLIELKAEQKINQYEAKKQQQFIEQQKQLAAEQPIFSKDEVSYAESLKEEKQENGEPLRPWMQANDKDFQRAQRLAANIVRDMEVDGKKIELKEVFDELDAIMFAKRNIVPSKVKITQANAEVLSGRNTITPPRRDEVKLSEAQRYAARKLGINEKAYAKSVSLAARADSISIDDF